MEVLEPEKERKFDAEFRAGHYKTHRHYLHIIVHDKEQKVSYSQEVNPDIINLDYNEDGELIGIELIAFEVEEGEYYGR